MYSVLIIYLLLAFPLEFVLHKDRHYVSIARHIAGTQTSDLIICAHELNLLSTFAMTLIFGHNKTWNIFWNIFCLIKLNNFIFSKLNTDGN